jgi:hypothetical protein
MTLIVDPVSVALDSFILEHGESVVESALQKAFGRPGQLVLPRTTTLVSDLHTVQQVANRLHELTADLCSRNSLGKLLLLFRKVRHELAVSLFAPLKGDTFLLKTLVLWPTKQLSTERMPFFNTRRETTYFMSTPLATDCNQLMLN